MQRHFSSSLHHSRRSEENCKINRRFERNYEAGKRKSLKQCWRHAYNWVIELKIEDELNTMVAMRARKDVRLQS